MLIVVTRTSDEPGGKGLSLIVAETKDLAGFERSRVLEKIGMHGQDTRELSFMDAHIPAANLLGGVEGRGFVQLMQQLSQERLDAATASMAKFWCTDMQNKVIDRCLQIFGGYGYMMEYPIARMYAAARVQKIYGGSTEIMKELVARSL